jgi:hypothetical protein
VSSVLPSPLAPCATTSNTGSPPAVTARLQSTRMPVQMIPAAPCKVHLSIYMDTVRGYIHEVIVDAKILDFWARLRVPYHLWRLASRAT